MYVSFPSYDSVKVFVGRRLVHRLAGKGEDMDEKYLKKIDDNDDDDDDDDDCDDLDRNDGDDKDERDDEKRNFHQYLRQKKRRRDASVISIQGTGEQIRIVFRSDPWVTRRGFFAHYSVGQAGSMRIRKEMLHCSKRITWPYTGGFFTTMLYSPVRDHSTM